MLNSFLNGRKMPVGRLLLIFLMLLIVVVSGTFAWLTYASKRSALVLTIGDINDTQIKLSPYQVTGTIAPGTTYTSGVYSNVEINKGSNVFTSFSLFYKINSIDVVLIENGLSYTVINTMGTDSVDDDVTVKSGMFSDLIDTSQGIPEEIVIMNAAENTSLSANTLTHYKVYLWMNSSVGNQNDVQGATLNVELNASITTNLSGDSFGVQLINNRTNDENLSDSLVGGLYRYQGTDAEVTNNYVCFGTSDKNECLSDKSTYMYRIIGVDQFGYIKTIKADSLDPMVVSRSPYSTVNWHNADLSVSLNGSGFLNNLTELPEGWSEKIATYSWPYGRVDTVPLENTTTGYEWYAQENGNSAWTDRFEGKIGLMYINDYIYAASSGTVTPEQRAASWIHITNTAYSTLNVSYYVREHLMTWTDNVYEDKWYTTAGIKLYQDTATGVVGSIFEWYALAGYYRPVFYIDATLQRAGGTGTETDPYIISDAKASGTYTINYYNGQEFLDSEEHTIGVAQPLMLWDDLGGEIYDGDDYDEWPDGGWEFAGWNISSDSYVKTYDDGQNVMNLSLMDGDEVNLYAIYSRPINFYTTIPSVNGGGTPSTVAIQYWNSFEMATEENVLSSVSLPSIPESNGWNAVGYSNVTTDTYGDYGFGYFSNNNQSWLDFEYFNFYNSPNLYASYYKNYIVNFNANGGTGTMNSVSGLMSHNLYYAEPTVETIVIPDIGFARPGYLFNGWVDDEGNEYNDGDDFEPSADDYNTSPLEYTLNATWWDGIAPTGTLNVSSTDSAVTVSISNVVEEGSGMDVYLFFMENDDDPSISYEHEDVNSNYTFMNVPAGTYTVTVVMIDNEANESEYEQTITVTAASASGTGPTLDNGMIPVKLSSTGTVTTVSSNDPTWYNYDNKEWANVVLVDDDSRSTYKNTTGVPVNQSDILAYYVWIPRYKYQIWTSGERQTIEIEFESADDPMSLGTEVGEWRTHPAFWWDDNSNGNVDDGETVAGIWVGKFETSSNTDSICYEDNTEEDCVSTEITPRIVPNVQSLRYQKVSEQFLTSQKFSANGNIYGLSHTSTNAHMMKNSEWGAVAYLSHSVYGINDEIRINNNDSFKTGCGALVENGEPTPDCEISYNSSSTPQSTTGNITGVFDMSGGAYEYVMGVLADENGNPRSGNDADWNSGFNGLLSDDTSYTSGINFPASKYYDLYTSDYSLEACDGGVCYGHALSENAWWYADVAHFVLPDLPWFMRGDGSYSFDMAGVFAFSSDSGGADSSSSWRSVLISVKDTIPPTCSLSIEGTSVVANILDNSGKFSYYGWNSSYSGTNSSTTELATGNVSYYVKDEAGNKGMCIATISDATGEYSCEACSYCWRRGGACYTNTCSPNYCPSYVMDATYVYSCSNGTLVGGSYCFVTE